MRNKILTLVLSVAVVAGLAVVGCAPEAAPPEEEAPPPGEEEAAPPAAPEAEVIEWRLQTLMPAGTPFYKMTERFCERLNTMAAGRLEVSPFPGGAIVPGLGELDGLLTGAIDAGVIGMADNEGKTGKVTCLFGNVPGGPNPSEYLAWYHQGGGHELVQELYDRKDIPVKVVGGPVNLTGAELFGWFKEPVTSIDDLKHIKFRTGAIWGEILNQMGTAVVYLPGGEIYQAFERGVIDAFEFCCPSMDWAMGFQDLGAYMHVPGIHSTAAVTFLHVSNDTWNALPPDLQAIVECAADANSLEVYWMDVEDAKAMKEFEDYGTKIVSLPVEVQLEILEQRDAVMAKHAAEDPLFAKVLDSQREFFTSYRALKEQVQPSYPY